MSTFLTLFIGLIAIHVVMDFYLQPASWVQQKQQLKWRSNKLLIHAILHGIAICLPVLLVTTDISSIVSLMLVVGVSHWIIDLIKVYLGNELRYFMLDQLLHLVVLIAVAFHATGLELSLIISAADNLSSQHIAIACAYLLIFKPSSIFISMVLNKYSPLAVDEQKGLAAGGEIIGYLERILILTFVIKGQFAVVGFILAAKSIFRFGDLNNAKSHNLTEYVLLGSLLSVTITSLLGIVIGLL